jgi:hypothetical protein
MRHKDALHLVVEHQAQRTAGGTERVGQRAFVEATNALVLEDLLDTIPSRSIHARLAATGQLQASSQRIARIHDHLRNHSDALRNRPTLPKRCVLWIGKKQLFGRIINTKVYGTVGYNTHQTNTKATVQSANTAFEAIGFDNTINEA